MVLNSFNEFGMICFVEVIYNIIKNKLSLDFIFYGVGVVSFCFGLFRLGLVLIYVCLREIRNKYVLIIDSNYIDKEYFFLFGFDFL